MSLIEVDFMTIILFGNWAIDSLEKLVERNIQGDGLGYFNSQEDDTRASTAEMLFKARGLEITGVVPYLDVKIGDWFYDAVCTVTKEEIIEGDGPGYFNPRNNLNRQQAATTIVRAFNLEAIGDLELPDANQVADWAKEAAAIAYQLGIVQGKVINGKTVFASKDNITRAQFATMLQCAIEIVENELPKEIESFSFDFINDLEIGQTETLGLTVKYSDGTTMDVTNKTTIKVGDTSVAIIEDGKIKGVTEGERL